MRFFDYNAPRADVRNVRQNGAEPTEGSFPERVRTVSSMAGRRRRLLEWPNMTPYVALTPRNRGVLESKSTHIARLACLVRDHVVVVLAADLLSSPLVLARL